MNTQFYYGDIDENKFYVERVYLDSPREDCNGYYSDMYGYPTAKEAWKAADKWNRSEEPEQAYCDLTSGTSRVYKLYYTVDEKESLVQQTENYKDFQEALRFARDNKIRFVKSGVLKFNYRFEIA